MVHELLENSIVCMRNTLMASIVVGLAIAKKIKT